MHGTAPARLSAGAFVSSLEIQIFYRQRVAVVIILTPVEHPIDDVFKHPGI
jgi:hypothetical protein